MTDGTTAAPPGRDDELLTLATRPIDGGLLVEVAGEVDMLTTPELRAALTDALARSPGRLVLDLTGVRFLGSSGIAVLVEVLEESRRSGTALALVAASRGVLRPLRSTGLADLFATHPDVASALAAT